MNACVFRRAVTAAVRHRFEELFVSCEDTIYESSSFIHDYELYPNRNSKEGRKEEDHKLAKMDADPKTTLMNQVRQEAALNNARQLIEVNNGR